MRIERVGGRGWDCNQFIVVDEQAVTYDVVDAGHGMDFANILDEVAQHIQPEQIRSAILTHEHLDHVNGLQNWKSLGARVLAPQVVAAKLRAGHDPTSAQFGMDIPQMDVDDVLADGETVTLGGEPFEVLATPGHAPGATCYWNKEAGVLFSGDTLFAEGGIGRFDFPDGDLAALHRSIQRLSSLPVQELHCGHGPSLRGAAAKRSLQGSLAHVQTCVAEAGA